MADPGVRIAADPGRLDALTEAYGSAPPMRTFHQRGHHVQGAHARRALANGAGDDAHTGCMIALAPSAADAQRLALKGGEDAQELHCTLFYTGSDAAAWDDGMRTELLAALSARATRIAPITSRVFGVAHWNGDTDSASWVWSVGDDPGTRTVDCCLDAARNCALDALDSLRAQPDLPVQHSPWVAHVCAAYTRDLSLARELEKRLGPVVFDRIWVTFGDEDHYIPLSGAQAPVTAAGRRPDSANGVFRRKLTAAELASRIDFAGRQRSWETAVDAAVRDLAQFKTCWRNQVQTALASAANPAQTVADLSLDTVPAWTDLLQRMRATAQAAGIAQQRAAEQQGATVGPWEIGGATTAALGWRSQLADTAMLAVQGIADRLAGSARARVQRLMGVFSGIRLASEVDQYLATLSDAFDRELLGAAMTAAQQAGQIAVLEAAPRATYAASEVLDDRCCDPCRQIDGKEFSSLDDAESAYPGGCYVDCQGGGRCRGTIAAVWGQGMLASAREDQMTATTEEDLGGKPNTGTPKDKRLRKNQMGAEDCAPCRAAAEAEHFGSSQAVSDKPWDGAASNFTDAQYEQSAAACDPGGEPPKERCFLPHHDPGGALNRSGLGKAAGRADQLSGHNPDAVARAKAHLRSHYKQIGEDVPDSLQAGADTASLADTPDDGPTGGKTTCPPGWAEDPDSDGCLPPGYEPGSPVTCPPGWTKDDDGDGCVPAPGAGAAAARSAAFAAATAPPAAAPPADGDTAPWDGVLAVEGITTGDGREFEPGALTWRDLPIPLRWNKEDSHGGEPHTVAVNVGRIDSIYRDGSKIMGQGVFDLSTPDGQTAYSKVKGKFLRGVSIDADSISGADVEYVWPQDDSADGDGGEPDLFDLLFADPEKVVYHGGRISAATLVDIPAFAEAYIALTDEAGAVVAGGPMDPQEWAEAQQPSRRPSLVAHGMAVPERPPAEWFRDPQLSLPTPVTIDSQGRVYGHAAQWGTCHIGQTGQCISPPREDHHAYYMTGELDCADGSTVSVGQITVGTGHASLNANAQAAVEHYDHTGWAVADVVVGNDAYGIWVAGAVRPGADPVKVAALRAAGQVSGDWRRIGGKLRLVGLLAVNVPGFPVPRMRARVSAGSQVALVAAGRPAVARGSVGGQAVQFRENELDQWAFRRVMQRLAERVHGED